MPVSREYINSLFSEYLRQLSRVRDTLGFDNPVEIDIFRKTLEHCGPSEYNTVLCEIIRTHLYWRIFYHSTVLSYTTASIKSGLDKASSATQAGFEQLSSYAAGAASAVADAAQRRWYGDIPDLDRFHQAPSSVSQVSRAEDLHLAEPPPLESPRSPHSPPPSSPFEEFDELSCAPPLHSRIELFNHMIIHVHDFDKQTFDVGIFSQAFFKIFDAVIVNAGAENKTTIYDRLSLPFIMREVIELKYSRRKLPHSLSSGARSPAR